MTEHIPPVSESPPTEPRPGTPEYIQRYAQLAMLGMIDAMDLRVKGQEEFDPGAYTSDQVVIPEAAVLYVRGPEVPDGSGNMVTSTREIKVHTHPPSEDIADTREFTYAAGKGWVTVQRGFGFPDPNLRDDELAYLQRVHPRVRHMAGLEGEI